MKYRTCNVQLFWFHLFLSCSSIIIINDPVSDLAAGHCIVLKRLYCFLQIHLAKKISVISDLWTRRHTEIDDVDRCIQMDIRASKHSITKRNICIKLRMASSPHCFWWIRRRAVWGRQTAGWCTALEDCQSYCSDTPPCTDDRMGCLDEGHSLLLPGHIHPETVGDMQLFTERIP